MPESVFKEEEEKEKKRREQEKKSKELHSKEEIHHTAEVKKEAIEKGEIRGMSFGEAKPLIEVGYVKTHIKGTRASEKYEPIVKETLAVKLIEDERRKEIEKITDEVKRSDELIKKEEQEIQRIRSEEKEKEITKEIKKEEIKRKEEAQKTQERIKKEREIVGKLLEEARKKGMVEPVRDLARSLIEREIRNGATPKTAIARVLVILKRLGLINTKKERSAIISFMKSLFKKK